MALTLGAILYVCLLLINSIAILSHDRFLVPLGLHAQAGGPSSSPSYGASYGTGFESYGNPGDANVGPGVKQRAVALVGAVRTLMRIPLIPINIVVIWYEILLG